MEKANVAGAAITLDVIKCEASAPKFMYAAKTVPDTVANPDDMITCSSEAVRYYMRYIEAFSKISPITDYSKPLTRIYGLMISGDSVIPRKIFAATVTLSHRVVPIIDCSNQPNFLIIHCMTPK